MSFEIAEFEKVSSARFEEDLKTACPWVFTPPEIDAIYNSIKLPKRATAGSAGYDFFSPVSFELDPNGYVTIPTGIRVKIDPGWRSKKRIRVQIWHPSDEYLRYYRQRLLLLG